MRLTWIAIRTDDAGRALRETDERFTEHESIAWQDGLARAEADELVLGAATTRGWSIVAAASLDARFHALEARVERLSRTFGEAHAFVIDEDKRDLRWVRCRDGELVRSFASLGGTVLRDIGERSPTEPQPAAAPAPGEPRFLVEESAPVTAADVHRIAAAWSIDLLAVAPADRGLAWATDPSFTIEWREPLDLPIGPVASTKEAELHAAQVSQEGCPRCSHRLERCGFHTRDVDERATHCFTCDECGNHVTLVYTAGEGWDDQPHSFEPKLTHRSEPSALLSPAFLLQSAERSSLLVERYPGIMATAAASSALAALDELEKHRDFVIPDRAKYKKLKQWLRSHVP